MTNPFLPQQPQAPAPAPAAPVPGGNPFMQQPAAAPPAPVQQPQQQHYTQQPQQAYAAPAANGGSPWPAGATAGAPNLVAQPGQFSTPPPPSASNGGGQPKPADLQGRLLLILPERLERGVPSRFTDRATGQPQLQDKLTATVIVLDGGPLYWTPTRSGQPQQPRNEQVPYVIKNMWITQSKLIEQLDEPLRQRQAGQAGLALGRLWKAGPGQNDPYLLAPAQPQDVQVYDQYVSRVNPFTL
jgi:hypothetical protein